MQNIARRNGAILVEASIGLVGYVLILVSVFSVLQFYRCKLILNRALSQTALQVSEYSAVYGKIGEDAFKNLEEEDELLAFLESVAAEITIQTAIHEMFLAKLPMKGQSVEQYLRNLGIRDGEDGLVFLLSEISDTEIHLVLQYEMVPLFLSRIRFPVFLHSSTTAWHYGDGEEQATSKEEDSLWKLNVFDRGQRFKEIMQEQVEDAEILTNTRGLIAFSAQENTYYQCVSINTFSPGYNEHGFSPEVASEHTLRKVDVTMEAVRVRAQNTDRSKKIEYLVIVPENCSNSTVALLQKYLDSKKDSFLYPICFTILQTGGDADASRNIGTP